MRMAYILTTLAILFGAAPLAADGPVALKDDPRLQTNVTLSIACEPVSALAENLGKATGVSITARMDIADLNVTVFASQMPACDAMGRVALILGASWEVKGDSPEKYSYTLFRSLKKKQEAEDLRRAYGREQDQHFKDTIEEAIKMVDADPATLQEEARKNPGQVAQNLVFRKALRNLACFTRQQRDDFWARIDASPLAEVRIPFSELPYGLQEQVRKQVDERHGQGNSASSEGIEKRELIISRGGGYGSPRISGLPLQSRIAFFGLSGLGGIAGLGTVDPNRQISDSDRQALKEAGIDTSFIKPLSPDFVAPESKSKRVKIKWKDENDKQPPPGVRGPSEGAVRAKTSHSFDEVIEAASRMLEIDIFAPDYICRGRNGYSWRTTFPEDPSEAVAEIGREFGYESVYDSEGCVALQCKTWYLDEARETPKRLVLRWADAKKKQGRLEFADYLEIARELDNLQIQSLGSARLDGDNPFSSETSHMGESIDRLRLCSMLTADQMKPATDGGLAYRSMTPDQQRIFAYLLLSERWDMTVPGMASCLFGARQETIEREGPGPDGKPLKVQMDTVAFTYTFGPGDEKRYVMLILPRPPDWQPPVK